MRYGIVYVMVMILVSLPILYFVDPKQVPLSPRCFCCFCLVFSFFRDSKTLPEWSLTIIITRIEVRWLFLFVNISLVTFDMSMARVF